MDDDLEARLESHAQAFEGLLSLMPAKQYYGEDVSNQWQRKKQTKEEKRAARKAKLDPQNRKTAKDVMDENERKRKRELGMESDNEEDQDVSVISNGQQAVEEDRVVKKRKTDGKKTDAKAEMDPEELVAQNKAKAEKRKEKRERKKEKVEKKKEKTEAKKARKQGDDGQDQSQTPNGTSVDIDEEDALVEDGNDVDAMDVSGLADAETDLLAPQDSSMPTSPDVDSPVFDTSTNHSAASSSSSIIPPAIPTSLESQDDSTQPKAPSSAPSRSKKEKAFTLPQVDQEELQSRLRARIEELRARRKADGADGQPARSRQDLLDERRKKSEARKQHKKELRLKAKQDEERLTNERLRGSGSPLSADIFSPRSPMERENNFSFGRVAFEDGDEADPMLTGITEARKKKGPQDPKTALETAQKKAERLSGLDAEKRADIEEKDLWLNAKKRAHGERIRDDQSLLKKALKRKEKTKLKSEKEWNERIEGVKKGQAFKQKRREENLAKRKDDKGSKKTKGKPKSGGAKKKGRPGFEGKFRA